MQETENDTTNVVQKDISATTKALGFAGITGVTLAIAFEAVPFAKWENAFSHSNREKFRRLARSAKEKLR
jgi:hypothetical protein